MADVTSSTDPYWTVAELLARVHAQDESIPDYQILGIVPTLAEEVRVPSIGYPCDEAGQPGDEWVQIPAHQWADLRIDLPPRLQPHPGDVYWKSSGRRAYAFVQFSERHLMNEWLAPIFARPPHRYPADIEIPPPMSGAQSLRPPPRKRSWRISPNTSAFVIAVCALQYERGLPRSARELVRSAADMARTLGLEGADNIDEDNSALRDLAGKILRAVETVDRARN